MAVADLAKVGMPVASVIRTAKIATIDARDAEPLGRTTRIRNDVARQVMGLL